MLGRGGLVGSEVHFLSFLLFFSSSFSLLRFLSPLAPILLGFGFSPLVRIDHRVRWSVGKVLDLCR